MKVPLLALTFALSAAMVACSNPFDNLNSVYQSQLRYKLLHVENKVDQCAMYSQGLKNKLEGIETDDLRPQAMTINLNILTQVRDMLRSREGGISSSLLSYTEDCLNILYNYQGEKYFMTREPIEGITGLSFDQQSEVSKVGDEKYNKEYVEELEKELKELQEKLVSVNKEHEEEIKKFSRISWEKNGCGVKLNLSLDKVDSQTAADSDKKYVEELEEKLKNTELKLSLDKMAYEAEFDRLKSQIQDKLVEGAKNCQLDGPLNELKKQLNQETVAKTECLTTLDSQKERLDSVNKVEERLKNCEQLVESDPSRLAAKEQMDKWHLSKCNQQLSICRENSKIESELKDSCENKSKELLKKLSKCRTGVSFG